MERINLFGRFKTVLTLTGAIGLFTPFASTAADSAGTNTTDDDWQFTVEAYGYLPTIEGTLTTGDDIELEFDDILENLDFTFLGVLQARKGKWAIVSDVSYLKLSADEGGNRTVPLGSFNVPTRVDIGVEVEGLLVNLAGAYRVHQAETFDVQILAGARYISLDVEAELDASLIPGEKLVDQSNDLWDAIIGVRGLANLSDKWWLTYRFDIGSGGSDLSWIGSAQFGRKYDWGSLAVGYRYIHTDFGSDFKLVKELDVHGPLIGAVWEF